MKIKIDDFQKANIKNFDVIYRLKDDSYHKIFGFYNENDSICILTNTISYHKHLAYETKINDEYKLYKDTSFKIDLKDGSSDEKIQDELEKLEDSTEFVSDWIVTSSEQKIISAKLTPYEYKLFTKWRIINNISMNKFLRMCVIYREPIMKRYGQMHEKQIKEDKYKQGSLF